MGYTPVGGRLTTITQVGTGPATVTYGWDPGFKWSDLLDLPVGSTFNGPRGEVIQMTANGPLWVSPIGHDADRNADYTPNMQMADGTLRLIPWDIDSTGKLLSPSDYRAIQDRWKQSGQIIHPPGPSS